MKNSYKIFDSSDLAALQSICGTERVIPRDQIGEDYHHDELSGVRSQPDVLVRATSTEEVAAVMKYAYKKRGTFVPLD